MSTIVSLASARAECNAEVVAAMVLQDLVHIQDRLVGYFHTDAGNAATDVELGAAALLFILAERLEAAARTLQSPVETRL
jgi:hypothetical protein